MNEAEFRTVLDQHPLVPGEDREAGFIICTGCHRVLGNPAHHLAQVLADALDPSYRPPVGSVRVEREDPRESYTEWRTTA